MMPLKSAPTPMGMVTAQDGAAQAQVLGLTPQAVGVHLGAGSGVDDEHRSFAGLHGCQGVAGKVGLARGVNQVDLVGTEQDRGDGGAHGEAAANLLGVVVQVGLAVMRRAQTVGAAGNVQHGLGERGLAGTVLAHEGDIPYMLSLGCSHKSGERGLAGTVLAHEGDIPYMLSLGCSHKSPSFRGLRGASP